MFARIDEKKQEDAGQRYDAVPVALCKGDGRDRHQHRRPKVADKAHAGQVERALVRIEESSFSRR